MPPRALFYEIRLTPSRVLSTESVATSAVARQDADAFARLLEEACDDFIAEVDFADLECVTLDWRAVHAEAVSVLISIAGVHTSTLWLLRGSDRDLDAAAVESLHEGLGYLSLRFRSQQPVLPASRLPELRPAVFFLLMTEDGFDPPPTLERLVRALAVGFFRSTQGETA